MLKGSATAPTTASSLMASKVSCMNRNTKLSYTTLGIIGIGDSSNGFVPPKPSPRFTSKRDGGCNLFSKKFQIVQPVSAFLTCPRSNVLV